MHLSNNNTIFVEMSGETSEYFKGILAIVIACVGFGSAHVPIRKFPVDDGLFVQFGMSIGIVFSGFFISAFNEFPSFQIFAAFGGCLWSVANTLSQRVISELGLAVGLLLWMSTNCLVGWSIGRFGLFGIQQKPVENDVLNILGVLVLLFGSLCIAFIKKVPHVDSKVATTNNQIQPFTLNVLEEKRQSVISLERLDMMAKKQMSCIRRNSERIICITLALLSGFLYCTTLVPIFYLTEHPGNFPNASVGTTYVFSHFFGVFMCSSTIFIVYTIIRKNKPLINPELMLPSFFGGVIWAFAMTGLIISNDLNGQTITYPLTTTMPGLIATGWSLFYFKEIKNYRLIGIAFLFICAGALLVLLSKLKF